MDENMENVAVTDEQVDAAWNETEEADQPAEVEAPANEPENTPEQPKDDQDGGDKPADQPEMFTIKNRDETRSVTRDELISMAQKGWDYDHVRQERDQLRQYREQADPALELVKSYAQRNNMSVPDYLDFCRKHELMASGMTQQDAEQRIRFDKERAELDRQRVELNAFRQQQDSMKQRAMEAQRKVTDMTVRCSHCIITSQKFLNCLNLCRRLHNNKIMCHKTSFLHTDRFPILSLPSYIIIL